MDCVNCREPMIVLETDAIEVDHCVACGGVWLDENELELLLGGRDTALEFLRACRPCPECRESRRKCPICRKKMNKVFFEKESQVIVDECPRRDGLWFDKGELQQVLQSAGGSSHRPVQDFLKQIFHAPLGGSK